MSIVAGLIAGALVGGVLLLLGSPLLYLGAKRRARYQRFRDLPVRTPATVRRGETALVTGTARPNEQGAITSPLASNPALLAAWEIHSLRRYGLLGVRHVWAPEALGVDTAGFELHEHEHRVAVPDWSRQDRLDGIERLQPTDTGQLPVEGLDVRGLWVEIEAFDTATRVRPDEAVPASLQTFSARVEIDANDRPSRLLPAIPWLRTPDGTLQYREATLQEGASITVLGTVRGSGTPAEPARLLEPDDHAPLVSPLGPDALLDRYRWSYRKLLYGLLLIVLVVAPAVGIAVAH